MLFLLATLAAAATAHSATRISEPAAGPGRCGGPAIIYAKPAPKAPRGAGVHRLSEEPPASEYLAVDRFVGGCPVPAVVRTGIGR